MKVLIVDDSGPDRRLCFAYLGEVYGSELTCIEAATGEQGLARWRESQPDSVLIDYKLPDMTGIEFLQKASEQALDTAVVMLTGLDSGEIAAAALKAGAHDYLVKDHIAGPALKLAIEKAIEKLELTRALRAERDRLAASLAEKEVLLKEVHHRVKNNLQVIASLLRLQANAIDNEALTLALRESQHRVESMAMIHEQLYETSDLREVDLAKHATLLAANLFQSYGVDPARITCRTTVECLPLEVDRAIPAGLILNELISNALKHAFPDGRSGNVVISGSHRDGRIILEVRDDGIGMPESVMTQKPKSMGLEIVNILTRQLKGKLETSRDGGASFRLSFPESTVCSPEAKSAHTGNRTS